MCNVFDSSMWQEGDNRVLTISQNKFCADGNIAGWFTVCML